MNGLEHQEELRLVADAMYDCAEWLEDPNQPYAVIDLGATDYDLIREFLLLYTLSDESSPQLRRASITWGEDQEEGLTFIDRFYEENKLILPEPSDEEAHLVVDLFLEGKQRYVGTDKDRAPNASVSILGMIAVYSYITYEADNDFRDFLSGRVMSLTYEPVEKLGAKVIVPRAFIKSMADGIPEFAELNRMPAPTNEYSNYLNGEVAILFALSYVLAPDNYLHPYIKEALFTENN